MRQNGRKRNRGGRNELKREIEGTTKSAKEEEEIKGRKRRRIETSERTET